MASVSVQDYLLTIYRIQREQTPVSTTALAMQLGVTPASVTGMVRKLDRRGLVEHEPYRGVILTDAGEQEALRLLRRHRLWELFLADVLGLSWDEVHKEAHRLEHATSERVMDKLAEFLHEPATDPHGHPIPARDGTVVSRAAVALSEVMAGHTVHIVEVPDDDADLLRFLASTGLYPGTELTVVASEPFDGPLTIRVGDSEHILERELANILLVNPIDPLEEGENA
jgi:DtxR family Mn-dependent transcriptional regulator